MQPTLKKKKKILRIQQYPVNTTYNSATFSRSLLRCKLIGVRTPTIYLADIDRGLLILEYLETAITCRDFIKSLWQDKDNQVQGGSI